MKLHLDYGFGKKLKRYLRSIKTVESTVFYKKGYKNKPMMVSLVTQFKSQRRAKSAHRYLKRKWERKKNSEHEVVRHNKSVIWYRKGYSDSQCFHAAVDRSKAQRGITESPNPKKTIAKAK